MVRHEVMRSTNSRSPTRLVYALRIRALRYRCTWPTLTRCAYKCLSVRPFCELSILRPLFTLNGLNSVQTFLSVQRSTWHCRRDAEAKSLFSNAYGMPGVMLLEFDLSPSSELPIRLRLRPPASAPRPRHCALYCVALQTRTTSQIYT